VLTLTAQELQGNLSLSRGARERWLWTYGNLVANNGADEVGGPLGNQYLFHEFEKIPI
jgi:hypothetical protein